LCYFSHRKCCSKFADIEAKLGVIQKEKKEKGNWIINAENLHQ